MSTLSFTACGGSEGNSAESYANDVCEDMNEWITALADVGDQLAGPGLSAAGLAEAAKDASGASDRLAEELDALEAPGTERGEETQAKVDEFAAALRGETTVIEQTLDSDLGLAARLETVAIVVSTSGRAGQALVEELRLNSGSELADAFKESSECETLSSRISDFE